MVNKGLRREMSRTDLTMASLGAIIGAGRSISDHLETEARQRAKEEHDRIVARAQWDIDRVLAVANDQLRQEAARLEVNARPSLDLSGAPSWR